MSIAQATAQVRHSGQAVKAECDGWIDAMMDNGDCSSRWRFPPLRAAYLRGYERGIKERAAA